MKSCQSSNSLAFHISFPHSTANAGGHFSSELTTVEVKGKGGKTEVFTTDEHPRETSIEKLGKLPPVFKENGTVTAGNASVSHSI